MIRNAKVADAKAILLLTKQLAKESRFMLHEPGEQDLSMQQQEAILADFTGSKSKVFLLLELDQKIVGFCVGIGSSARRNQHNLYCVMGIQTAFTGKGLGRELLNSLELWASQYGFTRLELTVMAHNHKAIKLYLSHGFEQEGIKRQSLKIDGEYVDEIYMSKLLV
ncbi:acetyltransferase, putative [Marinomonas sp. MED121]|uniref:GNAT family N-acetyltransferase n=1 Tax=Marinomonas sp. MED121 TaxID=314277 RepID=UPI0000690CF0|nr:GNAT family N-acetyltransferase [Marinomonas sp. MED121]EAQ65298.1 acetyltransferase, putative [Marinomonas sp. MED121]